MEIIPKNNKAMGVEVISTETSSIVEKSVMNVDVGKSVNSGYVFSAYHKPTEFYLVDDEQWRNSVTKLEITSKSDIDGSWAKTIYNASALTITK